MRTLRLMSLLTCLLLFWLAIGELPAMSAPVSYTINFNTQNGIAPTSGSFEFDASTATFTDFVVQWDSFSFDFTSIANAGAPGTMPPLSCLNGATGALAVFDALTECPGGGILGDWQAAPAGPLYFVGFNVGGNVNFMTASVTPPYWPPTDSGSGFFTATASPAGSVPEPGSFALTLIGIGFVMRKRIAAGLRQATRTQRSLPARH